MLRFYKKNFKGLSLNWSLSLVVALAFLLPAMANATDDLPVKGMVTMVDLGSDRCMPCRMMMPILDELKEKYRGRAAIVYVDVYERSDLAMKYGVRVIPTQIFYDHKGELVGRHEGFLAREHIEQVLAKLGVPSKAQP